MALVTPGTTRHGTPASSAGLELFEPAAEHEGVPSLQPDDAASGAGVIDEDPVDLLLRLGAPPRQLPDVDDLDRAGQVVEEVSRAESVGNHDVGLGERSPPRDRDQSRIAGPAADEHDTRLPTGHDPRQSPFGEVVLDHVAQCSGRSGAARALHRDGEFAVPGDRRGPGGTARGVVTAHTERVSRLRPPADRLVDAGIVGGGQHVPGAVEIVSSISRRSQVTSPASAMPSMLGVADGATTTTTAPAATSPGSLRWATCPPPATTTRRPASTSPAG